MYGLALRRSHNGAIYVTRYRHHFWASGYATVEAARKALHIARGLCEGQPLAGLHGASQATRARALREWRTLHRPAAPRVDAVQEGFDFAQLDT